MKQAEVSPPRPCSLQRHYGTTLLLAQVERLEEIVSELDFEIDVVLANLN